MFIALLKILGLLGTSVICFTRASGIDDEVRKDVRYVYTILMMCAGGLAFEGIVKLAGEETLPPAMLQLCGMGYIYAMLFLLLEGQKQWRHGKPPEGLMKKNGAAHN